MTNIDSTGTAVTDALTGAFAGHFQAKNPLMRER